MKARDEAVTISALLFPNRTATDAKATPNTSPRTTGNSYTENPATLDSFSLPPAAADRPAPNNSLPSSSSSTNSARRLVRTKSSTKRSRRSDTLRSSFQSNNTSSSSVPTSPQGPPKPADDTAIRRRRRQSQSSRPSSPQLGCSSPSGFTGLDVNTLLGASSKSSKSPSERSSAKQAFRPMSLQIPSPIIYPNDLQTLISPFSMTPRTPYKSTQRDYFNKSPKMSPNIRARSSPPLPDLRVQPAPQPSQPWFIQRVLHFFRGFIIFITWHAWDCFKGVLSGIAIVFKSLLVIVRTIKGQTELGQHIINALNNAKIEWAACPDPKSRLGSPLTKLQYCQRALQLAVVQNVTKRRFIDQQGLLQPVSADDPSVDRLELKRLCRFATATYGLRMLLATPPAPLLAAGSDQDLHKSVYANLSGLPDHSAVIHVSLQKPYTGALQRSDLPEPWAPQFFIVRDEDRKELVVVFRGTQSWHDVVMDISSIAETFELPALLDTQEGRTRHFKCHSGILKACRSLLQPDSDFIRSLANTLKAYPEYRLVFTGHSLGAGVAFVMAMMLASCRRSTKEGTSEPTWVLKHASLPEEKGDRLVKSVCFAAPNWCDPPLARLVARGSPAPLVTSIVLDHDLVPRLAWPQIRLIKRSLVLLSDLTTAERGSLIKDWLLVKLRLGDPLTLEERSWQIRKKLIAVAQETEQERCGPPGVVYQIERTTTAPLSKKWELHRVADVQRFYGAVWLSSSALSLHLPLSYNNAVDDLDA